MKHEDEVAVALTKSAIICRAPTGDNAMTSLSVNKTWLYRNRRLLDVWLLDNTILNRIILPESQLIMQPQRHLADMSLWRHFHAADNEKHAFIGNGTYNYYKILI